MKLLILSFFITLPSWACINLVGDINLNGESLHIDQKVDHDRDYSFMKGAYIVTVKLPSGQDPNVHMIDARVDQRNANNLRKASSGKIILKDGMTGEISKTDDETKETFSYKFSVKNI